MVSIDGFPIKVSIDMTPDTFDPPINEWSKGKTITIDVDDGSYCPIVRTVEWKGQSTKVYDYELFVGIIKSWIKPKTKADKGFTKDQALDLFFEMV